MGWSEIPLIGLGLALLISLAILSAWTFFRARRWRTPQGESRRLFVCIAGFTVWFSGLAVIAPMTPGCASEYRSPDSRMPAFPWPPPPASAETAVPENWLPTRGGSNLANVAATLERALRAAKYPKWSFSSVPDGFALVGQMEQIKADGTPSPDPARWSTDLPRVANMTLLEFVRALVSAHPGHYRVIVFVVTNRPWPRTGAQPTGGEADQWLARGFTWLPDAIGELLYGPDYRTTALVYEFEKISKNTDAVLLEQSPTSADDHLARAGSAQWLSRR